MKKSTLLRFLSTTYLLGGLAVAGGETYNRVYKNESSWAYALAAAPLMGMGLLFERSRKKEKFREIKIESEPAKSTPIMVYEDADTVRGRNAFWAYNDIKSTPIKNGRPYVH